MALTPNMPIWLVFGSRSPHYDLRDEELSNSLRAKIEELPWTASGASGAPSETPAMEGKGVVLLRRVRGAVATWQKYGR
jgi:hypothetical protein